MKIGDWLDRTRVAVGLPGGTLEEGIRVLLELLPGAEAPPQAARAEWAEAVAAGERGDLVRVHDHAVVVFLEPEGVTRPQALVGVATSPFAWEEGSAPGEVTARILFVLLSPGRLRAYRSRVAPALQRYFDEPGRADAFLEADRPEEILAIESFVALDFPQRARVREALEPVKYRVYADTPVEELVDLMMRRSLHAVPVVGEDYEVLGIVTTGDALRYLLPRMKAGHRNDPGVARDVMTRTVLCVSEDQELRDVAHLMVNRDVEQVPVVREGQLVGFVTRDSVLSALLGPPAEKP